MEPCRYTPTLSAHSQPGFAQLNIFEEQDELLGSHDVRCRVSKVLPLCSVVLCNIQQQTCALCPVGGHCVGWLIRALLQKQQHKILQHVWVIASDTV